MRPHTESQDATKAWVDHDALTYEVISPLGKRVGKGGPFRNIDALIRDFQGRYPGVWLTRKPKPEVTE